MKGFSALAGLLAATCSVLSVAWYLLLAAPAMAQQVRAVELSTNAEPELCEAAVKQARELLAAEGNVCAFPFAEKGSKLRPVRWKPASIEDTSTLLGKWLPLFGWNTRESWSVLGPSFAGTWSELTVAEYWRRYGDAMIAPIRSGQGSLEMANIDVDNDGDVETVYRVTTLQPKVKGAPQEGFTPLECSFPGQSPVRPYYSLLFKDSDRAAMGILSRFDQAENRNLATYDGATIWILMGPDGLSVSRIMSRNDEAFYVHKCDLHIK